MNNTTPTWALFVDGMPHTTGLTKTQAESLFRIFTIRDPHSEVEMYIKEEVKVIKYAVQSSNEEETNIFTEDGGVASIYLNEDGGHMATMYYQSRPTLFDRYMWYEIDEGKSYCKDWEGESVVTEEMVQDALNWLCPMANGFKQIDRELLFDNYNKRNTQELVWHHKSSVLNAARVLIEAKSGR